MKDSFSQEKWKKRWISLIKTRILKKLRDTMGLINETIIEERGTNGCKIITFQGEDVDRMVYLMFSNNN